MDEIGHTDGWLFDGTVESAGGALLGTFFGGVTGLALAWLAGVVCTGASFDCLNVTVLTWFSSILVGSASGTWLALSIRGHALAGWTTVGYLVVLALAGLAAQHLALLLVVLALVVAPTAAVLSRRIVLAVQSHRQGERT